MSDTTLLGTFRRLIDLFVDDDSVERIALLAVDELEANLSTLQYIPANDVETALDALDVELDEFEETAELAEKDDDEDDDKDDDDEVVVVEAGAESDDDDDDSGDDDDDDDSDEDEDDDDEDDDDNDDDDDDDEEDDDDIIEDEPKGTSSTT